jgi:hypothetical protein
MIFASQRDEEGVSDITPALAGDTDSLAGRGLVPSEK